MIETATKLEHIEQARKLAALGANDREISEFIGGLERTLYRWNHSEDCFAAALKLGKEAAADRVTQSLYRRDRIQLLRAKSVRPRRCARHRRLRRAGPPGCLCRKILAGQSAQAALRPITSQGNLFMANNSSRPASWPSPHPYAPPPMRPTNAPPFQLSHYNRCSNRPLD
jgi:hypothetical protein